MLHPQVFQRRYVFRVDPSLDVVKVTEDVLLRRLTGVLVSFLPQRLLPGCNEEYSRKLEDSSKAYGQEMNRNNYIVKQTKTKMLLLFLYSIGNCIHLRLRIQFLRSERRI